MNVYTLILKSGESVVLTLTPTQAAELVDCISLGQIFWSHEGSLFRVLEVAVVLKGEEVVEDERAPDPPFLTVDNSGPGMIP